MRDLLNLLNFPDDVLLPFLEPYGITPSEFRLVSSFAPYNVQRRLELEKNNAKLLHYTSINAATAIAESGHMWLRNARGMEDYSEIEYGIEKTFDFFSSPRTDHFWELLEKAHPGIKEYIFKYLEGHAENAINETYMACVSEQETQNELIHGRSSMWKARKRGMVSYDVAIAINPEAILQYTNALNTWTFPVIYEDGEELHNIFQSTIDGVISNFELVSAASFDEIFQQLFGTIIGYCVSLKHPGFYEEREWRIVHFPRLWPNNRMKDKVIEYAGSRELVYQLPFGNIEDEGLRFLTFPELVEKVIIGPMNADRTAMNKRAIIKVMKDKGITEPETKIIHSGLPLRDY